MYDQILIKKVEKFIEEDSLVLPKDLLIELKKLKDQVKEKIFAALPAAYRDQIHVNETINQPS